MTTFSTGQSHLHVQDVRSLVRVQVDGEAIVSRGPISFFAHLVDLTISGARFNAAVETLRPGHEFSIQMSLVGGVVISAIHARVRWMAPEALGSWGIGVAFLDVSPKQVAIIQNYLSQLVTQANGTGPRL